MQKIAQEGNVLLYKTIFSFHCLKLMKIKSIIITLLGCDEK